MLYNLPSPLIASLLFVLIAIANEVGIRIGEYYRLHSDTDLKSQTTAIQGGIIGILALLLGFTFNMSLNRFDSRAEAELTEANAIGTALLRTDLLPKPFDAEARGTLDTYIDLRLEANKIDLTHNDLRKEYNARASVLQTKLWDIGMEAAKNHPNPVQTGYYVQSINEVIDTQGARNAVLQRHVPEPIFYLLFLIFSATGLLTGYAAGLGTYKTRLPALVLTVLICVLVFIIIDLDRPRRGLIEVRQDNMEALRG